MPIDDSLLAHFLTYFSYQRFAFPITGRLQKQPTGQNTLEIAKSAISRLPPKENTPSIGSLNQGALRRHHPDFKNSGLPRLRQFPSLLNPLRDCKYDNSHGNIGWIP